METKSKHSRATKRRKKRWPILLLALIVLIGAGGWYYVNYYSIPEEPDAPVLQTAKVRTGDITITASGAGNLLPANELDIGFRTSGVLTEVAISVGSEVVEGELLARLDDSEAQAQVAQAEANLRLAELKLAGLTEDVDPVALAAAQATLAASQADLKRLLAPSSEGTVLAAKENLASAQAALALLEAGPDPEKVAIAQADMTLAEMNLRAAQAAYDKIAYRPDAGATSQATDLWRATTTYEKAVAEYQESLAGPAADEIATARAKVALAETQLLELQEEPDSDAVAAAEAKVAQAQAQLDDLLDGASAQDLETAELGVTLARYNVESAQRGLDRTFLYAPAAGTVVSIQAQPGEQVSATPILTLADLAAPLVRFWVEEVDLISLATGNPVEVIFEALPDLVFPGEVVRVDPALVTVDGTSAVQAWASIDLDAQPVQLLSGMTAEVEIIAGESKGTLLVPVQALRELAPGSYAVFVVQEDANLEVRPVTVGLRDFANAEILSGLDRGEIVSTGTVETE